MGIEIRRRLSGAQAQSMNQIYLDTARLLTQVAPFVFMDNVFALKGGTAINLFVRDMPRLSVDLDLVFPNHTLSRPEALSRISETIRQAAERLKIRGFQTHTITTDAAETKLLVRRGNIEIKAEVNFVLRGTIHPTRIATLTPKAREVLRSDLEVQMVSFEDLYGGKLVAAMDRQHPRDLFDVMQLFAHEGITPGVRRAFVVYLASHNRPIHEVLFPRARDITNDYKKTFRGLTMEPVELSKLLSTRERLFAELRLSLDTNERNFLLSLAHIKPDWTLLGIPHLEHLPGIQWKMQNLQQLAIKNPKKLQEQATELERRFSAAE